jgi:hypothetical protein
MVGAVDSTPVGTQIWSDRGAVSVVLPVMHEISDERD